MKYRVERMTNADYVNYMEGGYNYEVEKIVVEADSVEEAIKKVEKAGYEVNKNYVKTLDELEAERKAREAMWAEEEAKAEAAKAKRKATEARKAAEAGLTVEEYRKEKARKAHISRLEREIENLEKELKAKKAYLKKLEKRG